MQDTEVIVDNPVRNFKWLKFLSGRRTDANLFCETKLNNSKLVFPKYVKWWNLIVNPTHLLYPSKYSSERRLTEKIEQAPCD